MTVLIVSYHFYDFAAEGLVTAKLARALVDRGHRVEVISSGFNWSEQEPREEWVDFLNGITIHKVCGDDDAVPAWWKRAATPRKPNWLASRLAAFGSLVHACDPLEYAWVCAAEAKAAQLMQSAPAVDIMLTRLNPFYCHLVGLRLVRRFPKLPWCAYFSDPWPYHLYPPPYTSKVGRFSRVTSTHLLHVILARAGSLVFPSTRLLNHFLAGTDSRLREKSFVAPHLGNFQNSSPAPARRDILRIRHTGLLMHQRRIEPLLEGLRLFLGRLPEARTRIRIEFTGNTYLPKNEDLSTPIPDDLRGVLGFEPYKFPGEARRWLLDADVFLLVEAKLKEGIFMPSKLADYLTGRRPILALSPATGTVADYLKDGGGLLVEPDDAEGIAAALRQLYDRWQNGTLSAFAPSPEQARRVSPEGVVPIYEQAFAYASRP